MKNEPTLPCPECGSVLQLTLSPYDEKYRREAYYYWACPDKPCPAKLSTNFYNFLYSYFRRTA